MPHPLPCTSVSPLHNILIRIYLFLPADHPQPLADGVLLLSESAFLFLVCTDRPDPATSYTPPAYTTHRAGSGTRTAYVRTPKDSIPLLVLLALRTFPLLSLIHRSLLRARMLP